MRTTNSAQVTPTLGGAARRSQLLDCAIRALGESGYAGTSIAEVARRAGVSKGVVTYHFPTKQQLLMAVVGDLYEQAGARIGDRLGQEDGALGALLGYVEQNLAFVVEHADHVRAVLEVVANARDLGIDEALAPRVDPVLSHLQGLIEDGQTRGELADVDARSLALIIRAAIDAAAAKVATDPDFAPARYQAALTTLLRRSVGRPA